MTHDTYWYIAQRCNFKLAFTQKRCFCTTVLRYKHILILTLTSCIHQCWLFELWTVWFDLIIEFRQLHIDIVFNFYWFVAMICYVSATLKQIDSYFMTWLIDDFWIITPTHYTCSFSLYLVRSLSIASFIWAHCPELYLIDIDIFYIHDCVYSLLLKNFGLPDTIDLSLFFQTTAMWIQISRFLLHIRTAIRWQWFVWILIPVFIHSQTLLFYGHILKSTMLHRNILKSTMLHVCLPLCNSAISRICLHRFQILFTSILFYINYCLHHILFTSITYFVYISNNFCLHH